MDIAVTNLLCAEDLRGSENLDVDKSLDRLDEIATRVRLETDRNMHRFRSNPAQYENSEAYYRMAMLVMVLQQDFGIHYNPDRVTPVGVFEPNDKFFADSHDVFIHGLTGDEKTGTCASLPVFYIAVGRRLHYPLSLVGTKGHLFVRWEDLKERLNIEAAGRGVSTYDDNHYRKWPYPVTPREEKEMGFIKSMSATEECAAFLSTRGHCLMAAGRSDEAIYAYEQACRMAPDARLYHFILNAAKSEATARNSPPPSDQRFLQDGMPPDPSLSGLSPNYAWEIWRRRQRQFNSDIPDPLASLPTPATSAPCISAPGMPASCIPLPGMPTPGIREPTMPSPGQPFGNNNFGLQPSQRNR